MKKTIILTIILFTVQFLAPIFAQTEQKPELVTQTGHSGEVRSAIFSPDGKLIASNGAGGIIIWQVSTGRQIRRISGYFSAIDFAPDSKNVVAIEAVEELFDGEEKETEEPIFAEIFDVSNGKLVKKFPTHRKAINSVKFSNDGKSILTASDDHTAKLWNVIDGSLKKSFDAHKSEVGYAILSPNNQFIATYEVGSYYEEFEDDKKSLGIPKTTIIWNLENGNKVKTLILDKGKKTSMDTGFLQFSSDSKLLLTTIQQNHIMFHEFKTTIWNWKTNEKINEFNGLGPSIFSPDSQYVVGDINKKSNISEDEEENEGIDLLNIKDGSINSRLNDIDWLGNIMEISVSPNGKYVLLSVGLVDSGGSGVGSYGDESLLMYDLESGKKIYKLGENLQQIKQLSISKDNKIILVGDYVWNLEKGELVNLENFKPENLEREFNYQLPRRILSNDGKLVAESLDPYTDENPNSTNESGIQLWNTETGRKIKLIPGDAWKSAEFIFDNQFILAETANDVCLWKIADAKVIWCHNHTEEAMGLRATYAESGIMDGSRFSVISDDEKTVYIRKDENTLIAVEGITGEIIWQKTIEMGDEPGIFLSDKYIIVNTGRYGILVFLDLKTQKEALKVEIENNWAKLNNTFNTNNKNLLSIFQKSKKQRAFIDKNTGKIIAALPKNLSDDELLYYDLYGSRLGLSSDTKEFLAIVGEEIRLYNFTSGKVLNIFKGHNGGVSQTMFIKDDNYVISSSLDGTTRIWDAKIGNELCSLISFDNGTWIVTTPEGRFDTNNLESITGLHWIVPDNPLNPVSVEVFTRDYYEPKLLSRILSGEKFPAIRNLSDLNRTQSKIAIKEIRQTDSLDTVEVLVEAEDVVSEFQKGKDNKPLHSGVFDLRLFRDGQLVGNSTSDADLQKTFRGFKDFDEELKVWREANRVELKDGKRVFSFPVKLPNSAKDKPIEFSAYAFNDDRVKSETSRMIYELPKDAKLQKKPRRAYLVTFGVNKYENSDWDLQFAGNDARTMRRIVGEKLRERKEFEEVVEIPLISDDETSDSKTLKKRDATKANVRTVFDLLSGKKPTAEDLKNLETAIGKETREKIQKANPDDVVLVSFSSHGYADRNGIFYILPSDIGKDAESSVSQKMLPKFISSDELSLWMRDIDAGEMAMIVDACYADAFKGKDFKPAPMGSRGLGQLAFDKGMKILSATQAANVAIEANIKKADSNTENNKGHGLLTYALLIDGLDESKADFKAKDKTINLKEWLEFAEFRVPQLYEGVIKDEIKTVGKGVETFYVEAEKKENDSTQRPSLFDFTRKSKELELAILP